MSPKWWSVITGYAFSCIVVCVFICVEVSGVELGQLKPEVFNGDFLNHIHKPRFKDEGLLPMLLNSEAGRDMQQQYGLISKRHEMRRNHGMNSYYHQYQDVQENKVLAEDSVQRMVKVEMRNHARESIKTAYRREYLHKKNTQQNKQKNKTPKTIEPSSVVSAIAKDTANTHQAQEQTQEQVDPADVGQTVIDVADFIYRAQMGTEIGLAETTTARVRTDVFKGKYSLGFDTQVLNSSFDYRANSLDPINQERLSANDERASVGVRRPIKLLRASTGARYGLLQKTLSYSVDKQLIGNLSANVSRNTHLRERTKDETVYGLSYSLSF